MDSGMGGSTARHLLSAVRVEKAVPQAKPYRLRDGEGLFLYVPPSGVSAWQFRYKISGKSQTLTIGKLANMSLAEARKRAESARKDAADGKNLTTAKRVAKAKIAQQEGNTFRAMADSWMRKRRKPAWSATHREQVQASIDDQPTFGPRRGADENLAHILLDTCTRLTSQTLTSAVNNKGRVAGSGTLGPGGCGGEPVTEPIATAPHARSLISKA
jgi:hypothetical protein